MHDQAAVEGSGGTHIGDGSRFASLNIFSRPPVFLLFVSVGPGEDKKRHISKTDGRRLGSLVHWLGEGLK
jgi:hypothetical protein